MPITVEHRDIDLHQFDAGSVRQLRDVCVLSERQCRPRDRRDYDSGRISHEALRAGELMVVLRRAQSGDGSSRKRTERRNAAVTSLLPRTRTECIN